MNNNVFENFMKKKFKFLSFPNDRNSSDCNLTVMHNIRHKYSFKRTVCILETTNQNIFERGYRIYHTYNYTGVCLVFNNAHIVYDTLHRYRTSSLYVLHTLHIILYFVYVKSRHIGPSALSLESSL